VPHGRPPELPQSAPSAARQQGPTARHDPRSHNASSPLASPTQGPVSRPCAPATHYHHVNSPSQARHGAQQPY
jgi:hypothetical protein